VVTQRTPRGLTASDWTAGLQKYRDAHVLKV
jgi:hypothetical protein